MKKSVLLIIAVSLVLLMLLAGRYYFSQQDFGLSNPYWNGLFQFGSETRPIYDLSALSGIGPGATFLVISPQTNYTVPEALTISSFLSRGGHVVVMDDYGDSNSLLLSIGSPVTLDQVPLCQNIDYYQTPSFPVIKNIGNSSLMENVSSLVFDHPVSLNVTGNATIIASTSDRGWLDYNDNDIIEKTEHTGRYPVAAEISYGSGMLTVIGDPDLLINSMQDQGDNKVLASNILASGAVYVDMAHGQTMPPVAQAYYLIKYNLIAQFICVLAILLIAYIYYRRNDVARLLHKHEEPGVEPVDAKAVIIENLKKTPLSNDQIEELKRKL